MINKSIHADNSIGDADLKAFANALSHNTRLTTLELDGFLALIYQYYCIVFSIIVLGDDKNTSIFTKIKDELRSNVNDAERASKASQIAQSKTNEMWQKAWI